MAGIRGAKQMDQTDFAQPEEKPKGDETEPRRQL